MKVRDVLYWQQNTALSNEVFEQQEIGKWNDLPGGKSNEPGMK